MGQVEGNEATAQSHGLVGWVHLRHSGYKPANKSRSRPHLMVGMERLNILSASWQTGAESMGWRLEKAEADNRSCLWTERMLSSLLNRRK